MRRHFLILTSVVASVCALSLLLRWGSDIPYRDITEKVGVWPMEPAKLAFHSQDKWAAWCRTRMINSTPPPMPPPSLSVDNGEVIIVAAMGPMPDGSRGIRIAGIRETRASIEVHVRREDYEVGPCMVSSPRHIVVIEGKGKPILFVNEGAFLLWTVILWSVGVLSALIALVLLRGLINQRSAEASAS